MINPVHKIKRYVTYGDGRPPHWAEDTVVGWRGTGYTDKNGREIFEGDKVKFNGYDMTVNYKNGTFWISNERNEVWHPIATVIYHDVEIVGHIAEDD